VSEEGRPRGRRRTASFFFPPDWLAVPGWCWSQRQEPAYPLDGRPPHHGGAGGRAARRRGPVPITRPGGGCACRDRLKTGAAAG